mgnify:CR=1 FL=1
MSGGMQMEKFVKRVAAVPVLALAFALALPVFASAQDLVPIGETVGIEAVTDGLLVASLSKVETPEGEVCPAADGGILPGDIIVRVGGSDISTAEDFTAAVSKLDGESVEVTVLRDEKALQLTVTPAKDLSGEWRMALAARRRVRHRHGDVL